MEKITLIASSTMGLESVVKDECVELGFENVRAFNGRVEFEGTVKDIVKANIHLRCADRVFIKMGEFKAVTFEDLFRNMKKIEWADFIPPLYSFLFLVAFPPKHFSNSSYEVIT